MSVSGVGGYGGYSYFTSQTGRTGNKSASASNGLTSDSSDDAAKAFLDYMHETPAQRMFDSWLGQQRISKEQYAAMSPEQQQKLKDQFEEYMRKKMEEKLGSSSTAGISITA